MKTYKWNGKADRRINKLNLVLFLCFLTLLSIYGFSYFKGSIHSFSLILNTLTGMLLIFSHLIPQKNKSIEVELSETHLIYRSNFSKAQVKDKAKDKAKDNQIDYQDISSVKLKKSLGLPVIIINIKPQFRVKVVNPIDHLELFQRLSESIKKQ